MCSIVPDWMLRPLIDVMDKKGRGTKYDLSLNLFDPLEKLIDYHIGESFYENILRQKTLSQLKNSFIVLGILSPSPRGLTCKVHRHVLSRQGFGGALVWPQSECVK